MHKATLKKRFEKTANDYLREFIRLMGFDPTQAFWVGNVVGHIVCVDDLFVDYRDIRFCVDNRVDFETFAEWYDYCVDVGSIDERFYTPCLEDYVGDHYNFISKKRRDELRCLKKAFLDAVEKEIN